MHKYKKIFLNNLMGCKIVQNIHKNIIFSNQNYKYFFQQTTTFLAFFLFNLNFPAENRFNVSCSLASFLSRFVFSSASVHSHSIYTISMDLRLKDLRLNLTCVIESYLASDSVRFEHHLQGRISPQLFKLGVQSADDEGCC